MNKKTTTTIIIIAVLIILAGGIFWAVKSASRGGESATGADRGQSSAASEGAGGADQGRSESASASADQSRSESGIPKGTSPGKLAPTFEIKTLAGKTIKSADLRGRVVVITSGAAWCPTCALEADQFAPVYKKYQDQKVTFITVDIDPSDDKPFIQKFKKDHDTPWAYADAEGGRELIQKYDLNRFEITLVIDPRGVVRFKDRIITNSKKLDEQISKLVAG